MAVDEFRGVYPVVSTPFHDDGSVDHEGIERIVAEQAARGAHGVVLFGMAPVCAKLGDNERQRIVKTAAEARAGTDIALVVGVTDSATYRATRFAQFAEASGADGLLVVPPGALARDGAAQVDHVRAVVEAVSIPVVGRTGGAADGAASMERLGDLARSHDGFRGVQRSNAAVRPDGASATASGAPTVLSGVGAGRAVEQLDRGAGLVPAASLSDVYVDLWERYRDGDREGAQRLADALRPLVAHVAADVRTLDAYERRLLAARGLVEGTADREPSFAPDEHADRRFTELFDGVGDLFE